MGLQFEKTQAIGFGDIVAVPHISTELRLRLQKDVRTGTVEELCETKDLLAECFTEKRKEIREFMDDMTIVDLQRLQTYLVGGDTMLQAMETRINDAFDGVSK